MIKILFVLLLILIYYSISLKKSIDTSPKEHISNEKKIVTIDKTIINIAPISEYITELNPSKVTQESSKERKKYTSQWISAIVYQDRFDNNYYSKKNIYPSYVELDKNGNRRVISLPYEPRFHWYVISGRTVKSFQKYHIKQIMNGKRLLTMSSIKKADITLYTGVWVSEHVLEREVKKLRKLGIYPPQLKKYIAQNKALNNENSIEEVMLTISTGDTQDSDTKGRVYMSINNERKRYLLDLPNHRDRALGSINHYQIKLDSPVAKVNSIKLSIKGYDAWKMKSFTVQLKSKKAYLKRHHVYVNRWFSQEEHDKRKLNAKESYVYYIEE